MAFASLFTLSNDITAVLDDVALMTKAAAKKTADVVGDDLASNANRVTGVSAERELPIVWSVAKGSFVNKLFFVPVALLLSAFLPQLITPLLTAGGGFICALKAWKSCCTSFCTDMTRSLVMTAIGIGMTVWVYGIVAVIVKLDDLGMLLMRRPQAFSHSSGQMLTAFMPWFMRGLSVVGTLAMFLAGSGLVAHNLGLLHDFLHAQHWDAVWAEYFANLVVGLLSSSIASAPPCL